MKKQYIIIITVLTMFSCTKARKLEGEYTSIFTTKGHKFQNEIETYLVDTLNTNIDTLIINVDKVYNNTLNWNQSILNRVQDSIYGVFNPYKESFASYIQIRGVIDFEKQLFNGYFEYLDSSYYTAPPYEEYHIFKYGDFTLKKN